jgi:hypothetical protein
MEERELIPYSGYKSYLIEEIQEKKLLGVYENLLEAKTGGEK